jgi:hypothetical protein
MCLYKSQENLPRVESKWRRVGVVWLCLGLSRQSLEVPSSKLDYARANQDYESEMRSGEALRSGESCLWLPSEDGFGRAVNVSPIQGWPWASRDGVSRLRTSLGEPGLRLQPWLALSESELCLPPKLASGELEPRLPLRLASC